MKSYSRIVPARAKARVRPARPSAVRPDVRPSRRSGEDLVALLTSCIEKVQTAGYPETAEMLAIARLDLLARVFGLGDDELELLVAAAAKKKKAAGRKPRLSAKAGQD